jgi:phosphoribosylglycinamide formyltransferase-1
MARLRLGVLISGSGTNLQSILDACAQGRLDAEVALVVSNRPKAGGIERARRAGVPVAVISHRKYDGREAFEDALIAALNEHRVQWVALAGFMRLLTPRFLRAFPERVVNIHPALLPAFPGVDGQQQALDYGVKVAGCTVHFVDAGTDSGPIIAQAVVAVLDDDDLDALKARILEQEHRLYPMVLQLIAEGRVHREGRRVRVDRAPGSGEALVNPLRRGVS